MSVAYVSTGLCRQTGALYAPWRLAGRSHQAKAIVPAMAAQMANCNRRTLWRARVTICRIFDLNQCSSKAVVLKILPMGRNRRILLIASTAIALLAQVTLADAQASGPTTMMGPGMMGSGAFGRMCGPAAAGFAEWRIARIEQVLKLSDTQRAKFDELKTTSSKAADVMRSACPTEFPRTVVDRMAVMEKRADAMLQGIKAVRPAMEAFYATLSDEQKTRLDSDTAHGRFWHWRYHW